MRMTDKTAAHVRPTDKKRLYLPLTLGIRASVRRSSVTLMAAEPAAAISIDVRQMMAVLISGIPLAARAIPATALTATPARMPGLVI